MASAICGGADNRTMLAIHDETDLDAIGIDDTASIIMAIATKETQVTACSYYTSDTGYLFIGEDCQLGDNCVVEQLLNHIQPTIVLISARASKELHTLIQLFIDSTRGMPFS